MRKTEYQEAAGEKRRIRRKKKDKKRKKRKVKKKERFVTRYRRKFWVVCLIEPNKVFCLILLKGRGQRENVLPPLAFPHFYSQPFPFLPHSGCLGFVPLNGLFTR